MISTTAKRHGSLGEPREKEDKEVMIDVMVGWIVGAIIGTAVGDVIGDDLNNGINKLRATGRKINNYESPNKPEWLKEQDKKLKKIPMCRIRND